MAESWERESPIRRVRERLEFRPGEMPPLFGDTAATLVVDDDPLSAELAVRILGSAGYRCTVAAGAAAARAALATTAFALALVDVLMPDESGLQLAPDLLGSHPDLALVMVTGVEDPEIARLALESGAYGYVVKPYSPNELLITAANAGRRRCLEIAHASYEARLEALLDDRVPGHGGPPASPAAGNGRAGRATEVTFRALLETAPDAIVGVDASGRIALVNAQVERLFGYRRDELVGQSVEILVPEAARAVHPHRRAGYLADPVPRPMGAGLQLAARRKDGTEFPAEISLSALDTDEGVFVSAAVRDVTERIEAQAEREGLRAQAERERLERRLQQSQRLESLGQLAGGVAHDFNNLLGAIINYAAFVGEAIEEAARFDDSREWGVVVRDVEQIRRAADRGAGLTHQLLSFARREVVHPELLVVNDVVVEVEQLLRRTLGEHVELVTLLDRSVWPVLVDRGQFEQVLVNLAVNARDAMPAGGTLTIETANVVVDSTYAETVPGTELGNYVRLRVTDSGSGMPPEVAQRAFEPFFTTKPKGEGTGLGLATVYGIVTQAGGSAGIYSEPGMGTAFVALLPAAAGKAAGAPRTGPPRPPAGGGETVLVVEDEDAMREVTERILLRNGYRVLTAANGPEALALLERTGEAVDLLVTDVVMPQMLGNEVATRVRALRPGVCVLFMSGYAQTVLGSRGTLEPSVHLVDKPFSEAVLIEQVRTVLEERAPAG